MTPTRQGSIRLFRFAGIDLFLHWSWFVVAVIEVNTRSRQYSTFIWNVLEYLALFAIVLLHEFGHALACRQVGGQADQIVLWPLGGVAYVSPPQRPGAFLWSIAAGPLVNVVLAPFLFGVWMAGHNFGWAEAMPNFYAFVQAIAVINLGLLIFNLMPVYPLDGGQILRSLLWFFLGRARSLMVASVIGLVGVAGVLILAFAQGSIWIGIIGVFILLNCWRGLAHARLLAKVAKLPRREGFTCPSCQSPPVLGPLWRCAKCHQAFDTFESHGICPHCGSDFPATQCIDCGGMFPFSAWCSTPAVSAAPPPLPFSTSNRV